MELVDNKKTEQGQPEAAFLLKEATVTEKECAKLCINKVCQRCGEPISPIKTVDNAHNPTHWAGCLNCSIFSGGTPRNIYDTAKALSVDYRHISMDDLCMIALRLEGGK